MENNNCQKCKVGIGNPSKALHNRDLHVKEPHYTKIYPNAKQAVLVDCLKCNFCSHFWIPKQNIEFRLISSEELMANRNSAAEYIL